MILFILSSLTVLSAECGTAKRIISKEESGESETISAETPVTVKLGVDVLIEYRLDVVAEKRIGLITNPSGVNNRLESTIDVLFRHPDVNLTTLFAPEHGIRGDIEAGKSVKTYTDPATELPVYSLYGDTKKPNLEMLSNVDVLLFDIQDIGVRPYTYIYTMALAMEAAKEAGITFCVLDRPNPINGTVVEGNVLDQAFKSFIGLYPIPYVHGMTVGELAWLFNMEFGIGAELLVIPMQGWTRNMNWTDTGLDWVPTSPHVPEFSTVPYMATTGFIGELGTIQLGIGYTTPFKLAGAPWIDPDELIKELAKRELPGVVFRPMYWRPFYGLWRNTQVGGIQIHISDMSSYKPFATGLHILDSIHMLYGNQEIFKEERISSFNRAVGTNEIMKKLSAGVPADIIIDSYQNELDAFKAMRQEYLLYR